MTFYKHKRKATQPPATGVAAGFGSAMRAEATSAAKKAKKAPPKQTGGTKKRARTSGPTRHPLHQFDAFSRGQSTLPVPGTLGNFVTVSSLSRNTLTTKVSGAGSKFLIVQWTQGQIRGVEMTESANIDPKFFALDALQSSPPQTIRPLCLSVSIRATSPFTSISGSVRIYNAPQTVLWEFSSATAVTAAMVASIKSTMSSNPAVRTFSAAEMLTSKRFVLLPASNLGYREYENYISLDDANGYQSQLLQASHAQKMNTLIFEFSESTSAVDYECVVADQSACRYAANQTLLSSLARPPPPSNHAGWDAGLVRAQAAANSPMDTTGPPIPFRADQ
jgi:hypothetical protein